MGRVISTAIQFIDAFTKPSQEVIDSMRKMGKEAIAAGKQIKIAGKNISSVGSNLTKNVTVPILALGTAAVKTSADFGARMSEVQAISRSTGKEMSDLKDKAIEMGAKTKFSANESADAFKFMAQAGWTSSDMISGIDGVMALAAASGEDLALTSGIVTDSLTAFGLSAKDTQMFADTLAMAANATNTSVAEMGDAFKYIAPVAGAMNYSVQDTSVALGIMANSGIKASTAGTSLRSLITNLAKPTEKMSDTMKKYNISLTDSHGNMLSLGDLLKNLRNRFSGMSESQKAAYASTLAGKEGMSGLLSIVNASDESFETLTKNMYNASGSAADAAAIMQDNLKGSLEQLGGGIESLAISFGDILSPTIRKIADHISAVVDKLNNMSDAQKEQIVKIATLVAAIGPSLFAFGKLVSAIGAVKVGFGSVLKTIANFSGIIGVITSPAGIVIGVLAAIAVAALLIIKNWDKIKPVLTNVGNWFKNIFEKAGFSVEGFRKTFESIGQTIGTIADKIIGIVKMIGDAFIKNLFGDTNNAASKMNDTFTTITKSAITAFDFITKAVDKGLKVFSALLDFFTGAFQGNWDSAAAGFRNSLKKLFPSNIADGLIKAFDFILPIISARVGAIKGLFKSFVNYIKEQIENIKTIFKGIGQFIEGVFSGDWKKALEGLKTITSGVFKGLITTIKQPFVAIGDMIKGAVDNFGKVGIIKSIFSGIGNAIKKVLTSSGVNLNKFKTDVTNIKNKVGSVINNLKTIFGAVFGFIGKVIKAAATVVANIFGKKVSKTCSAVGAVVIAFKAVIGAVFNAIASKIKGVMAVIVPVVKVAFSAIKGWISAAVKNITSIISGLMTVFDGITTFISGVFTGNWSKAWEGIKTIFKGVFDSLAALCKAPINAVIGIINGAISGINKLDLTIPDWVPGLGGKGFNMNIPTIPMLYKGTNNWRGGAAMIHDRGAEIVDLPTGSRVYPHDKSIQMARQQGAASGSKSINITINKLADKLEVRNDSDIDKIAEALAKKLQKVSLNMGVA